MLTRASPPSTCRPWALLRQRGPPMLPAPPCVLVSALIVHAHIPFSEPTERIGTKRAESDDGFPQSQVTSP
jgi:hypothetical protein